MLIFRTPIALALATAPLLIACGDAPAPLDKGHTPPAPTEPQPAPQTPTGLDVAALEAKPPAPELPELEPVLALLGAGAYPNALTEVQAVRQAHPDHPRAQFLEALTLHKLKRYAEAEPLFRTAAQSAHSFDSVAALPYYLGWCDYWLGDFDAARAAFTAHVTATDEPDSHFGLGIIALELGELEAAEAALELARLGFEARFEGGDLAAARDLGKSYARLADVALARDQDELARDHLQTALGLDGERPAVWFKLYNVALALDDKQLASLAKRKYETLSPNTDQAASQ